MFANRRFIYISVETRQTKLHFYFFFSIEWTICCLLIAGGIRSWKDQPAWVRGWKETLADDPWQEVPGNPGPRDPSPRHLRGQAPRHHLRRRVGDDRSNVQSGGQALRHCAEVDLVKGFLFYSSLFWKTPLIFLLFLKRTVLIGADFCVPILMSWKSEWMLLLSS